MLFIVFSVEVTDDRENNYTRNYTRNEWSFWSSVSKPETTNFLDSTTHNGQTALNVAIEHERAQIAEVLINHGATVSEADVWKILEFAGRGEKTTLETSGEDCHKNSSTLEKVEVFREDENREIWLRILKLKNLKKMIEKVEKQMKNHARNE